MHYPSNKLSDLKVVWFNKLQKIYPAVEAKQLINLLILNMLGLSRSDQALRIDYRISESEMVWFHQAVKQLLQEKPLQYILRHTTFYGLPLEVNEAVLIPRPETEELIELILKENKLTAPRIVDLGTGSGCIALALKKNLPQAKVKGVDISQEALQVAQNNAQALELDVDFNLCNLLDADSCIRGVYDIMVSNPPYVTESDKKSMQKNVLDYEPGLALFVTNADPLQFYRSIVRLTRKHLRQHGKLYVEINEKFGTDCADLFVREGLEEVRIHHDIHGKQRFVSASKP